MRAVVFDYFGTLTPSIPSAGFRRDMADIAGLLGVDADALHAAMTGSWRERATGMLGDSRATLAEMARRCGGDPAPAALDAALSLRLDSFLRWARPRPESVTVLESVIARGMGTAVVTDCPPELVDVWPRIEVSGLVHGVVRSCETGVTKPDPSMFLAACTMLAVEPSEAWYVGDGGGDELRGAAEVGMRVVWLDDGEHDDRYVQDHVPGGEDVTRIGALAELVGLIGG